MRWFREHKIITLIIAIVIVLVALLISSFVLQGQNNAVGRVTSSVVNAVQRPISEAGSFIGNSVSGLFRDEEMEAENEELKERIRELESELVNSSLSEAQLQELNDVADLLNANNLLETYDAVTAKVIALDGSNYFNVFTIDAGTDDGIDVDAVVVNGDGLVGRVVAVTSNTARIIGIVDESNSVGFEVYSSERPLGICEGDGSGNLTGYMLDENAIVQKGNNLITSGISGLYPAGLSIGQVTDVEWTHDSPLKSVSIEPSVDFRNIKMVTVLI